VGTWFRIKARLMEFSVMHLESLCKLTFGNDHGRQGLAYCKKTHLDSFLHEILVKKSYFTLNSHI